MSDKYASLGEYGEILVGPSGLQLDNQEMVDLVNNLQAENERLNQRLAEYESTPDRALKAVFGNFDLIAYSSAYIAIKREGDPNPLIVDEDGYITKRDI